MDKTYGLYICHVWFQQKLEQEFWAQGLTFLSSFRQLSIEKRKVQPCTAMVLSFYFVKCEEYREPCLLLRLFLQEPSLYAADVIDVCQRDFQQNSSEALAICFSAMAFFSTQHLLPILSKELCPFCPFQSSLSETSQLNALWKMGILRHVYFTKYTEHTEEYMECVFNMWITGSVYHILFVWYK